jgi:hypothetical protein
MSTLRPLLTVNAISRLIWLPPMARMPAEPFPGTGSKVSARPVLCLGSLTELLAHF